MKQIPLTKGQVALVDDDDYEWLMQWKWYATQTPVTFYAQRSLRAGKSLKMHRFITDAPPHLVVDHIDHNGLNNTRANLRLVTQAVNHQNRQWLKPPRYVPPQKHKIVYARNRKVYRAFILLTETQSKQEAEQAVKDYLVK